MKKTFKKFVCGAAAAVMLLGTAPMAKAATPFTDVPADAWYASFVDYVYKHNMMAGTSDTTFSPNQTMTRGMLVTVLYSGAGRLPHSGNNPFSDVGDTWYTDAVIWCYENGIVAGTSATTFSPNSPVTREQMVTILYKFMDSEWTDVSPRADLSVYSDNGLITPYAREAFSWAVAAGVVKGASATELAPQGIATRAQCAVVLQGCREWLGAMIGAPETTQPAPTAPALTEPKPTEHVHQWAHHHEDAEGYNSEYCVCNACGWSFCIDGMSDEDITHTWFEHEDEMMQQGEQHSYTFEFRWVETKPAVDYWTCSCGVTTDVNPG